MFNNFHDNFDKEFNDNIKFVSRCPLCNTEYQSDRAEIIEEKEGEALIYVECLKCKSSIVATVMFGGVGLVAIGLVTDLNKNDIEKFKEAPPISSDEMLEVYKVLKKDDHFVQKVAKFKNK